MLRWIDSWRSLTLRCFPSFLKWSVWSRISSKRFKKRWKDNSGEAVRNPFIILVLRSNLFFPLMAHLFLNAINRKKKMDRAHRMMKENESDRSSVSVFITMAMNELLKSCHRNTLTENRSIKIHFPSRSFSFLFSFYVGSGFLFCLLVLSCQLIKREKEREIAIVKDFLSNRRFFLFSLIKNKRKNLPTVLRKEIEKDPTFTIIFFFEDRMIVTTWLTVLPSLY